MNSRILQCQLYRHFRRMCLATSKYLVNLLLVLGCQKTYFFHALAIFWSAEKRRKDTFFHPSSPFLCHAAAVVAFLNSRFNVHCYTQREPKPTQKSARKWHLRPFATSCAKEYERHSLVQTSFAVPPNKRWMLTAIFCPSCERKQGCPREQWYSGTSSIHSPERGLMLY